MIFKEEIENFRARIDALEEKFEKYDETEEGSDEYDKLENELEHEIHELEYEINMYLEMNIPNNDVIDFSNYEKVLKTLDSQDKQLKTLLKRVDVVKRGVCMNKYGYETYEDCYEDTMDYMFPNRHDDDFDEDSMSYDSVFGDD